MFEICVFSCLSVTCMQRRLNFVLKPDNCKLFSLPGYQLSLPGSIKGLFFCHLLSHRVVFVHIPEQLMKLQVLWTATAALLRSLCILGALETRTICCLQRSVLHLCPPGPPLYLVGPLSLARSRKPCWFFQLANNPSDNPSTILHPYLTRTSNIGWDKSAETMKKSMSNRWSNESLYQLYLCISLCWKKCSWCIVRFYNTVAAGSSCCHLC